MTDTQGEKRSEKFVRCNSKDHSRCHSGRLVFSLAGLMQRLNYELLIQETRPLLSVEQDGDEGYTEATIEDEAALCDALDGAVTVVLLFEFFALLVLVLSFHR